MAIKHHLTHGSLFSGIGGFDLAAEWAGFQNIFHCDYDDFCRQALEYHFPNSDSYADIINTDFSKYKGQITVLTGGFPCQPFSLAGKRRGTDDSRYLWPQMLRAIREIRPTWVIGENVVGITSMVLPSEEVALEDKATTQVESEFVIEQICRDLEGEGYTIQPFLIPACSVGAPHRRDRVWIIAHLTADTNSERCNSWCSDRQERHLSHNLDRNATKGKSQWSGRQCGISSFNEVMGLAANSYCERCHEEWRDCNKQEQNTSKRSNILSQSERPCQEWTITNSNSIGQERRIYKNESCSSIYRGSSGLYPRSSYEQRQIPSWSQFPTQPPLYAGDDGLPRWLADKPFSHTKWRKEAVKASGNAIVPQVAYEILKGIYSVEINSCK